MRRISGRNARSRKSHGGACGLLRSALEHEARRPIRDQERRQDRLQHQRGAAGGADRET
jgi:hypothetical protein